MMGLEMPKRLPKHCVEDVDRYGKVRVYLRVKGRKKVKLSGTPWTADFMRQYGEALKEDAEPQRGPESDTWEWLCRKWFAEGMGHLGERSKRVRRAILARTFDEPIEPGSPARFGDMPLRFFGPEACETLRDRLFNAKKPEAANGRLKAIRQVCAWAVKPGKILKFNPAREVPYIRTRSDGFYTWTREDAEAFEQRHPVGTKARLAYSLLLYLGVRRSDVVTLGRQHIRNGRIRFTPRKTATTTGGSLELPILPSLQRAIEAGPCGDLTFLVTERGKPYGVNGFGNWFRRRCREAGLPQCSAHGLRKLATTLAAENGATDAELQAIFGWKSEKMPQRYRRKADKNRLADRAMHKITVQLDTPVGLNGKK